MKSVFAKALMTTMFCAFCGGASNFVYANNAGVAPIENKDKASQEKTSKQIVTEFFDLAFVQRQPVEAALKYISADKYIQHNPAVKDGREMFIKVVAPYLEKTKSRSAIKRVIAEGDLVVVHSHGFNDADPKDRGAAVVDIFRVEGGKIVEHWDVIQAVPEKAANANTMF